MFPTYAQLREMLRFVLLNKEAQGHDVEGLLQEWHELPDSYDMMHAFAQRLAELPMRADWPYVEPDDLPDIWAACDPSRPLGPVGAEDRDRAASRVEQAFLGRVCGCMLGKPLEVNPTYKELRTALEAAGEWPLGDYVGTRVLDTLGRRHASWAETTRGNIRRVVPDDDLNYTVLGMLLVEAHGLSLTTADVRDAWLRQLPIGITFGPERTVLAKSALAYLPGGDLNRYEEWARVLNPHDEKCGALIRVDAYAYACPGRPSLAAELAWRDARYTHRRTGVYGAMFVAAAIATALAMDDPLAVCRTALQFVPQRSRFYERMAEAIDIVAAASDWESGYRRIHRALGAYDHCLVYQECATLVNTLRFAESVGHGISIQVMQGNDTDSYGATAGSLLGALFGPGHLDSHWLAPFGDEIETALARFHARSLAALAARMADLPQRVYRDIAEL